MEDYKLEKFKFPQELVDKLDRKALMKVGKLDRSELYRTAVIEYMAKHNLL